MRAQFDALRNAIGRSENPEASAQPAQADVDDVAAAFRGLSLRQRVMCTAACLVRVFVVIFCAFDVDGCFSSCITVVRCLLRYTCVYSFLVATNQIRKALHAWKRCFALVKN